MASSFGSGAPPPRKRPAAIVPLLAGAVVFVAATSSRTSNAHCLRASWAKPPLTPRQSFDAAPRRGIVLRRLRRGALRGVSPIRLGAKKKKESVADRGPEAVAKRLRHEVLLASRAQCWPTPLERGMFDPVETYGIPTDDLSEDAPTFFTELAPGNLRCRLSVAYDGTQYHGWPRMRNRDTLTVSRIVDAALSLHVGHELVVLGAGRTDAGVHARGQGAHFDLPVDVAAARPVDWRSVWEVGVNSQLPSDVRVFDFDDAPPGFHASFSATGKTYVYRLHVVGPADPLERLYRYEIPQAWADGLGGDLDKLRAAALRFVGTMDFAPFARPDPSRPNLTTVRTIESVDVIDEGGGRCRIEVRLDGALWRMVRNVVGCILALACGRLGQQTFDAWLASEHPERNAGALFDCLPARGLCLEEVRY